MVTAHKPVVIMTPIRTTACILVPFGKLWILNTSKSMANKYKDTRPKAPLIIIKLSKILKFRSSAFAILPWILQLSVAETGIEIRKSATFWMSICDTSDC